MRGCILLVLLIPSFALPQSNATFYSYFGSEDDDVGYSIVQTMNRGYFILGNSNGFGALQTDILLSRLDSTGVPLWNKLYGGMGNEVGTGVVELSDSSLILTGYTSSFGNGGYDAVIYRVDKLGSVLWQSTSGGLDWDFGNSVALTNDNNIVVCGTTYSYGRGLTDGFILKMDLNGNQLWVKFFGGTKEDEFKKVIATGDGGYVLAGTTKSYGDSLGDMWIFKVNSQGDSLWQKLYGGPGIDVANSVIENPGGELYVTGCVTPTNSAKTDAALIKLSNTSAFIWESVHGLVNENEVATDVLNSGSNYGKVLMTFATREVGGYGDDVKTLLFDGSGYYLQGGSFGSTEDEIGYALTNTNDKGYMVCGFTKSFNAQAKDVFIIKYDSVMGIGPLVVPVKEFNQFSKTTKVWPLLIEEDFFSIYYDKLNRVPDFEIHNLLGIKIEPERIEYASGQLIVYIPQTLRGFFLVTTDEGKNVFRCISR